MPAHEFVDSLLHRGIARVAALSQEPGDLLEAVRELDNAARPEMPGAAPPLAEAAAIWGLRILYRSCQFLAYREVSDETVCRTLCEPCPGEPSPTVCYSVDLAMRYLPELLTLARGIAPGDPLVVSLQGLARQWPLSSVGAIDLDELDLAPFIDHPSLRQLYVDRVIERRDDSRLRHPVVREAAMAAIGAFPELAPAVAHALNRSDAAAERAPV